MYDFCGKCSDLQTDLSVFENVSSNKKFVISVGTVMHACINNHAYDKAILLHEGYSGQHNNVTNKLFLKACGAGGQYQKLERCINSMYKDINYANIEFVNSVVHFHGKNNDIHNALAVFNHIPQNIKEQIHQ